MRGHLCASLPTMAIVITCRKASTRTRFRGDGMDMLGTIEVITTHPISHSRASPRFCDNVP
jgi:hypothetical protein